MIAIVLKFYEFCLHLTELSPSSFSTVLNRGGVEDTRLEAKDTKKIRGQGQTKDSLSKDRPFRDQGQECSRPRTEDTGASVLLKKKRSSKIFFRRSPIYWRTQNFLIKKGLNHKSHDTTSSKFFQRGSFAGQRYRRMKDLKSLLPVCT